VILEFELREKEVAGKVQFSAPAEVTSLTYSEAQRVLFGGTASGGLFAVDADSLELRSLAQFKSAVNSLAIDEAGETLAVGLRSGELVLCARAADHAAPWGHGALPDSTSAAKLSTTGAPVAASSSLA